MKAVSNKEPKNESEEWLKRYWLWKEKFGLKVAKEKVTEGKNFGPEKEGGALFHA